MPDETPNPEEEVKTTPNQEGESDDAKEFEALFTETDDSENDVETLRKDIEALKKGVSKFFSERGQTKQVVEPKKQVEVKTEQSDDISELFFAQIPQAELVQSDLKNIADKLYGGSILKAWRNEVWIQDKAKALSDAKKEDEVNKTKISKPSNSVEFTKNIEKVKEDEVGKLTPAQQVQWLEAQAAKERRNAE
jgi:hypothetical protein